MDLGTSDWTSNAVSTGTTIIGVSYKDGVIMGADTRVTTGTYISNRVSDKITALSDSVYLCRSGSAADTQLVSDYARYFLSQYEMEFGGPADVATVATVTMQLNYNNKEVSVEFFAPVLRARMLSLALHAPFTALRQALIPSMLQAGMIVGGWDKYEGASVYALPIGGTKLKVPFATGGSGSTYLFGFCDSEWRPDMTADEAEAFVVKAVALAMARDGGSGGCVRTVRIDKSGAKRTFHPPDKLPTFYEEVPAQAPTPPLAL